MKARYRYRIYPKLSQQVMLAKTFGCVRVVWNDALAHCRSVRADGGKTPSGYDLKKLVVTQAKQTPERSWLSKVSSIAINESVLDLGVAFKNFFASLTGKRKGAKVNPPRFKSRRHRQSFRLTRGGFSVHSQSVKLAKIGHLRMKVSRPLPSAPSSVTVIKDASGRYFASFVVEVPESPLPECEAAVGIDVGLETYATLSTGEKVGNPRWLRKLLPKLRRYQKSLSRKQKGSSTWHRQRQKVAKLHAHITDCRTDFIHKLSTRLVRENQAISVEDLCLKGLVRTRLAKSLSDAGLGQFVVMVEAKCNRYGRHFVKVDRMNYPQLKSSGFPSSH